MNSLRLSTATITATRQKIVHWYKKFGRNLPWRHTHDPYRIVVSEVMLQQTQVDQIIARYQRWLKRFPTIQALAKAPITTVLKEWSGLGYNRRALALHRLAQTIAQEQQGKFPTTETDLIALPGIGPYTARAVQSFAYQQPVAVVDTNVKRVLGRVFLGYKTLAKERDNPSLFWALTERVVPRRGITAYQFNQGIMDIGATICTAKQPKCHSCPLRSICKSYPEILTASSEQLRVKTKRLEPQYFGQPRRIWRGRILAILLKKPNTTIPQLGKQLQADWNDERREWLEEVVKTMKKDGLI